jgi:hypothetical protein
MRTRLHSYAFLLCALLVPALATAQVSGPTVGFVFQPGIGVRQVLGILGSSILGPAVDGTAGYTRVEFSPRQEYALAQDDALRVRLLDLRNALRETWSTQGPAQQADQIVMSPMGSAAAVLYNAATELDVYTGLPDSPSRGQAFDISSLPGSPTAFAISDDAQAVVVAVVDGESGSLYLLQEGGPQWISSSGRISAIAFLENSRDAVLADHSTNRIEILRSLSSLEVLAGETEGVMQPSALAVTGAQVFVANGGSGTILVLDGYGAASRPIPCGCSVTGIHRMQESSVLRLTEPADGPLFLLDGGSPETHVYFVPAAVAQ